jgi:hypothetical protein
MSKYTYKIKEKKEDDLATVIEYEGKFETTLAQWKTNIDYFSKQIDRMEAERSVNEAKMKNVIINGHGKLSTNDFEKMTEDDLRAVFVYGTAWIAMKTEEEKIEEFKVALDADSKELQEILKQTGLSLEPKTKEEKFEEVIKSPVK